MVRSAECGGSPLANALPVKDVVGPPEGVPQGVNPRVVSLTHSWKDVAGPAWDSPGRAPQRNMQCCRNILL